MDSDAVAVATSERLAAERESFLAAIREGLKDADEGSTRPAEEVFADIRKKHGF